MSPRDRRERSPEERELARLEREAKRARRAGRPPPEIPPHLLEAQELAAEPEHLDDSELLSEAELPHEAEQGHGDGGDPHAEAPSPVRREADPDLVEPEPEPPLEPDPPLEAEPPFESEPGLEPPIDLDPPLEPDPPPLEPEHSIDLGPPTEVGPPDLDPPDDLDPPTDPDPTPVPEIESVAEEEPGPDPPAMPEPYHPTAAETAAEVPPVPRRRLPHKGEPEGTGSHGAGARDLWRRRGGRVGRPRRRRFVGLLVIAALLAGVGWVLVSLFQPLKGEGQGRVLVKVPAGAGAGDVGDILERRGVVASGFFFQARATIGGHRTDLKPGTFRLKRDMSYTEALDALTGGPPPNIVEVTVPEGRSRTEVQRLVRSSSLRGSYILATRRSKELDPRRYGARRVKSLEGFLFPDSYELKRRRPVQTLVDAQLAAFKREFSKVDLRAAKRRKLTPYDVLIIASMIEREAAVKKERRVVSSVIYNRLRGGIPLGIDATIRFETNNWTRPLRESELQKDSPYNTRLRKGLPPGPIGSPGIASIRAAADPARTKFIYYVVKPGSCGEHAFSRTDAQFQRDAQRYNTKRRAKGGKSPTKC